MKLGFFLTDEADISQLSEARTEIVPHAKCLR
jgi:hypothetical protein